VAKDERFTALRDRLLESFGQEPEMAVDSPA
jgi:hypothetical protein